MQLPVHQSGFKPVVAADDDDIIEFRELLSALNRRRFLIGAMALIGAAVAYLLVSQITPRYTARAALMLDPRAVQVLTAGQIVPGATINNALIDTEVSILETNLHLQTVIESIPAEVLSDFDPITDQPGAMSRLRTVVSEGIDQLLVMSGFAEPRVEEEEIFVLSPEERRLRRLIAALRSGLQVYREGDSYIISVVVETEEPDLSALFADRIVSVYIEEQIAQRSAAVRGASQYIFERVEQSRREVEAAEQAAEYLRANQIALSGVSVEALERQRIELSTQLSLARAELATAHSRHEQIQNVIEEEGIATAAELLSSPFILSLREQLSEEVRREADLATRFDEDHIVLRRQRATMVSLSAEIEREVGIIVSQLENEWQVAQVRLTAIQSTLGALEEGSSEVIRSSLELRQLEREAEAVRANYQALLLRLNEARAIEDLQQSEARVVERAQIPNFASAPRTTLFTAFGGTLGLAVGLLAAFYSAVVVPGLTRSHQVERVTGLPLLAELPRTRWRNPRQQLAALRKHPNHPFAEGLRRLRVGLQMQAKEDRIRSLLVTSSVPAEGKTTACIGLAYIEALSGRSCVVLDFDLRRTSLARALRYRTPNGDLADLLRGTCSIEDATYRVVEGGFDLISLHQADPELVDNISNEQIRTLISALEMRYDVVLVDTPPILSVPDALQISRFCDATLFVIHYGETPRRGLTEAARNMHEYISTLRGGAVFTMVNPSIRNREMGIAENVH